MTAKQHTPGGMWDMCGGDLIVRIESVGSPHVGGGRGFL